MPISTTPGPYPSNSEQVWPGLQFQSVASVYQPAVGATPATTIVQDPFERIFPALYNDVLGANPVSPKGYFIIDAIRRGEGRVSAVADNHIKYPQLSLTSLTTPGDRSRGGATVVAEFAGRVFYGGFDGTTYGGDKRSPTLSNFILFSQLVRNITDIHKCYQEGDPTSREASDLVDTDGGFIKLSGIGKVITMISLSSHLIVLADNGVWSISGGSEYGFSATNFKTQRISTFGVLGPQCAVTDSSRILYWSTDGIYVISKDKFGEYGVDNISETTIQTYYDKIPVESKRRAIGIYDAMGRTVRWMYHTGTRFTSSSVTREIVLDLSINAFYVNRVHNTSNNSAELISPFRTEATSELEGTSSDIDRQTSGQYAKYLCVFHPPFSSTPKYTFCQYNNTTFTDWEEVDGVGVDAHAYMVTGNYTADDGSVHKQVPYLVTYFRQTEVTGEPADTLTPIVSSSCLVQTMWDWSTNLKSNKWSTKFQTYRHRSLGHNAVEVGEKPMFEMFASRHKIRGRGRAFGLRFETEPKKDCRLIGWSLSLNGNSIT